MQSNQLRKARSAQDHSTFYCGLCKDIVIKPKQCFECGCLFCQSCIINLPIDNKNCPSGCSITQIKDISAGLRRIYNQIDVKCKHYLKCQKIIKINQLENHEDMCQAAQCKMKGVCNNNILKNKKFNETICSKECYLLDLVKTVQNPNQLYQKLNKILNNNQVQSPLEWDQIYKANFIRAVGNRITIQNIPVFSFVSAIAKTGFTKGEHYWEIHDFAHQSLLKVGVTTNRQINYNTGFSDQPTGFAYYALGQLRNGSDSKGPTYGSKHISGTPLGVYLNMDKGILGFVINGQYQGHAFTSPLLCTGTIYPAVSFLKAIDCIITSKQIPVSVKLWH